MQTEAPPPLSPAFGQGLSKPCGPAHLTPASTASPRELRDPGEDLLAAAALSLLAQPRLWPTLKLPPALPEMAAQRPWSTYWSARLDPTLDPAAARAAHAAVLARFDHLREREGALLALAALIETYYLDEAGLQPLDTWVDDLQRRLPADNAWPSAELQAQVMACGLAITLRDQAHPLLARWAAHGPALLRQLAPGAARLKLATFLLQYHIWRGEFGQTGLIVNMLPGLEPQGLLPAEALVWYESVASHARFTGQHDRAIEAIAAALDLLQQHGLQRHAYALHAHGAAIELAAGHADRAATHLQAMRPALEQQAPADQTHYWHMHAGWHLLRGDTGQALAAAQMALSNSQEIGGPPLCAPHRPGLPGPRPGRVALAAAAACLWRVAHRTGGPAAGGPRRAPTAAPVPPAARLAGPGGPGPARGHRAGVAVARRRARCPAQGVRCRAAAPAPPAGRRQPGAAGRRATGAGSCAGVERCGGLELAGRAGRGSRWRGRVHGTGPARMALARRVLGVVRGPFLPDAESPWAMAARERYRRRFVRTIAHLAQVMEQQAPEQAAHLYERALDVDPLAESLHRHLMQLFARLGEQAEALRAWRHCQAMLHLAAELAPSAETRALAGRLGLE